MNKEHYEIDRESDHWQSLTVLKCHLIQPFIFTEGKIEAQIKNGNIACE
jgi:hypothetical protein